MPITLGYLQGVLPEGVASAWLGAIVRRSFQLYLRRLIALQKAQLTGAWVGGRGKAILGWVPSML